MQQTSLNIQTDFAVVLPDLTEHIHPATPVLLYFIFSEAVFWINEQRMFCREKP